MAMTGFGVLDLATALGLVLVLEGLLLALAPDLLKRVVAEILAHSVQTLRLVGLLSAAAGVIVVWLVRG
jgi:uncharacterized protein